MQKISLLAACLLISGTAASQQSPSNKTIVVPADGGAGGANATVWKADCSPGTVMTGIEVAVGGTCHNQCNADGRPLVTFRIHCPSNGSPV